MLGGSKWFGKILQGNGTYSWQGGSGLNFAVWSWGFPIDEQCCFRGGNSIKEAA